MLKILLHFASMLLHFALVLHFVAILITFCGDYYISRRNRHEVSWGNFNYCYSSDGVAPSVYSITSVSKLFTMFPVNLLA